MRTIHLLTLLLLSSTLAAAPARAQTGDCVFETTIGLGACAFGGSFSGGDGSCSTTGSYHGTQVWAGVFVRGEARGVEADNDCYAYAYNGTPYDGSQLAVNTWQESNGQFHDQGEYLNTGTVHAQDRDHPYCYLSQIGEHGEVQGSRIDCPVLVRVPVVPTILP